MTVSVSKFGGWVVLADGKVVAQFSTKALAEKAAKALTTPKAKDRTHYPAEGTKLRRVWDICDELEAKLARQPKSAEVQAAYVAEGGNFATAATQYYRWRDPEAAARYNLRRRIAKRNPTKLLEELVAAMSAELYRVKAQVTADPVVDAPVVTAPTSPTVHG